MRDIESYLEFQILNHEPSLDQITPSLQIQAHHRGRLVCDLSLGERRVFFDLASLTKILFTNTVLMRLLQKKEIHLNQSIFNQNVTLKQVLAHQAGFQWWRPFYKDLKGPRSESKRWQSLCAQLREESSKRSNLAVYSDVGYLQLGCFLIHHCQKSLSQIWMEEVLPHLKGQLHFLSAPVASGQRDLYAPTGFCDFRKRSLQAEVHDANAWALGGISTHAGLFGRIEDVTEWGLKLRSAYYGGRDSLFTPALVRRFVRRSLHRSQGDWGLGFMKPTKGSASCSSFFAPSSFGHLGFTGTSFWMDPAQDLIVTILSNRTAYGLTPNSMKDLRPLIHQWLVEGLRFRF